MHPEQPISSLSVAHKKQTFGKFLFPRWNTKNKLERERSIEFVKKLEMSKEASKVNLAKPAQEEMGKAKIKSGASVIPAPKKLVKTMVFESIVQACSSLRSSSSGSNIETKNAKKSRYVSPYTP